MDVMRVDGRFHRTWPEMGDKRTMGKGYTFGCACARFRRVLTEGFCCSRRRYNPRLMWEGAAILLIAAGMLLWVDSLRARERAVQAGRKACERYDLQLLDDTVSFARLRLQRDEEGQVRIARTYTFEFSDTGNNRRHGAIVMLGGELQDLQLEPYRVQ